MLRAGLLLAALVAGHARGEPDASPVSLKAEETASRLQAVGPYFGCSSEGAPSSKFLPGSGTQYCSRAEVSTPGGNVTDFCRYDCGNVLGGSGTCNSTDALLTKHKAVDCEPVSGCVQAYFDEACIGGAWAPTQPPPAVCSIVAPSTNTPVSSFVYHGLNISGTGTGAFTIVNQVVAPEYASSQPMFLEWTYEADTPGSIVISSSTALLFRSVFVGQMASSAPAVTVAGSLGGLPVKGCSAQPKLSAAVPAARVDFTKGCIADTLTVLVTGGGDLSGSKFITMDTMDVCPAAQPSDLTQDAGGPACPPRTRR